MAEFTKKEELTDHDLLVRIDENIQTLILPKIDEHDKFINGNGSPGAKVTLSSLRSRVTMLFAIGGALWAAAVVFGSIYFNYRLDLVAKAASSTPHP